ncbi:S41 family peptidase [Lutibacter aestuarii]|uniref:Tricorn protease homolog n=1 Tax=Lutibacter aestuarii TaxID=861111 RepID=A0ABW2Z2Z3_9FLAO
MKNILFTLTCILTIQTTLNSQNNPLINSPTLSPNGETIAFNYQGDIWTTSKNGDNLKRLTIHEAYDTNPIWSPDGKTIAFQSNRFGNNDVFTIPSTGGIPKRITYHSSNDQVTDFTTDNNIIFSTARNFVQIEREPEVHSVNSNGGTPFRLLNTVGFDATLSPNKKFIAFTKGSCRIEREAYQGPANRDIWLYDIKNDSYHQLTSFVGQDLAPQWANNNTLYFQSARSGKYNIHKLTIDQNGNKLGEITQITNLKDMGIFSFDLSSNGTDIVMTSGDKIWLLDITSNKTTPISITINSDYRFDPIVRKSYTNNASEVEVSPNGKLSAIVIRGEIFITENNSEKNRTISVSNSAYKDEDVVWLNDEVLLFVSDRNGTDNIYAITSNDAENKNLFSSLKHQITQLTNHKEGVSNIKLAPNKKSITFNKGYGKLIVASIDNDGKISNEKTLVDGWDTPSGISWSPDSKWLAYSLSDLYFNDEIYIHKADNSKKPVNISMHPKSDFGPIWSEDGSKIGFSSNRNNGDHDIWFVWLQKKDWEKTQQDWEEITNDTKEKKDKNKEENSIPDIIIDFDNIHERQQQVTAYNGGEFLNAISKDGKTFYYTTGNSGRGNPDVTSNLYKINWDGKENKELTKGNTRPRNISLTDKEDYIYYISSGRISRIKLANAKKESIPFNAKMIIDYTEEANQIFEQAWKTIEDRFYDPNHHGQNWNELKKTYKPLALKASTRDDFKIIFNKMLGQINASHMGMYRGEDRKEVQNERTGILGVELMPMANNKLKISYVVPNSAADREISKLLVGDIINTVNGEKVSTSENIYKHLVATTNEKIILGITSKGVDKEIIIRPKSSGRTDNYNAWVKERKRLTEKYSNGKLGYIHIQGMNWTSFEHFERELTAAGFGKEGIVIDVRYNGGGWTTDYLMAVLNVKQHAYTIPRGASNDLSKDHKAFKNYYPFSERLPLAAWTKPSIALCNQNSYSNAEIFSHAYKELGLGKLVGIPTFGAVISTGGQTLIDGSYVRVPYRGWYVKSSEKNMDFTPAMPDIVINNSPDDRSKGTDTQLKKAVEELLKDI